MIVKDVTKYLEKIAPLHLQESYDNSGLQVGDYKSVVKGVLVSLDVTMEVIDDAINKQCNLIVAHHPIIFGEIKNVTKSSLIGSIVFKAIKNNINIYAIHTNLDNVPNGVNSKIAEVIGLKRKKILLPKQNLLKLVVFVPESHSEKVSQALFSSGAGNIGNYKNCIFSSQGEGSFLPTSGSNPYKGKEGRLEKVKEEKLEVIFPDYLLSNIIQSMNSAHPYEEVAYDIFKLLNNSNTQENKWGVHFRPAHAGELLMHLRLDWTISTPNLQGKWECE